MNQTNIRYASTTGGIICTSDPRASQAGVAMLDAGGNCIDAAIAAGAVLNVVEPYNSHLGGDAFLIHYSAKDGKVTALNGSGGAPECAKVAEFAGREPAKSAHERALGGAPSAAATLGIPLRGIRASTVPGQVHTWFTAHDLWGRLTMATLLDPAITYARDGFEVSRSLANTLHQSARLPRPAGLSRAVLR